jgi:hypothetical protein
MATPYFIAPSPPAGFAAAIFAVSYERPLDELHEIERKLAERGVTGAILLDMLLANASASHRYFVLRFDGIKLASIAERAAATQDLENYSRQTFKTSPLPLDTSLLLTDELRALC